MKFTIWHSSDLLADWLITNTALSGNVIEKRDIHPSDALSPAKFHAVPDHIKQILYLDAPDLIVEVKGEPIFSLEVSAEAGTGHNAFQRFARLAAAVEKGVPAFYVYPEAIIVERDNSPPKWDSINPLVFKALDDLSNVFSVPALLYYYPTHYRSYQSDAEKSPNRLMKGRLDDAKYAGCPDSRDGEMQSMFRIINELLDLARAKGVVDARRTFHATRSCLDRKSLMLYWYADKKGSYNMSPLSATSRMPTDIVVDCLEQYASKRYPVGPLLRSRSETIVYKVNAKFRGDPYPGALAAIDYLCCREGPTYEDRKYNLVIAWGDVSIDENNNRLLVGANKKSTIEDFTNLVKTSEKKNLLGLEFSELGEGQIPRYYMQVRYGSTFSKQKQIRIFAYFADAIIFPDGALWRDG